MNKFDLEAITRVARKQKLGLGNAEKDYVLSVALSVIAELPLRLVFKGGTCIKKAYYPEFRFSSDLDFSSTAKENEDAAGILRRAFENKEVYGVKFVKTRTIERDKKGNAAVALQYESIVSGIGFVDSVRTEFSAETPVLLEAPKRVIINPVEYALPETQISCMALEEILAEKIHSVYHRRKPRDLYDLAFLLDKGVGANQKLIAAKLKPLNVELNSESFKERTLILGGRWKEDLSKLFLEAPDFEAARAKALKKLFQ